MGVAAYAGHGWAERLLRSNSFDLALISYWEAAATLVPLVRQLSPDTRVVVNSIDLHFLRDARRSLARRAALDGTFGQTATRELNTYSQADAVLAVSDKERDLLATSSVTVPSRSRSSTTSSAPRIRSPSAEARCSWATSATSPTVRRSSCCAATSCPCSTGGSWTDTPSRCWATGSSTLGSAVDPATPGVDLVGWVPSVRPYLNRARLAVVPLLHGAGVKGKVVQPMMGYTPVVTTPSAPRGWTSSRASTPSSARTPPTSRPASRAC